MKRNKKRQLMKRKLIQCATKVNREAIKRTNIDGVEHIIISSFTLPENIVMNGGLYPAEEINSSFHTLERTLAPVEHPQDSDGNYISASDPIAIHNYHAGAFNTNVEKDGDRIRIDKFINVQEAMKTERGKRLLDRINEIETNESPRPIHTSVGVFLLPEMLDKPMTNSAGQEYTWVARDMTFDHDAILLDSVGAAQPDQGVGIGVNAEGEKFEIERFTINEKTNKTEKTNIQGYLSKLTDNAEDLSMRARHDAVEEALRSVGLNVHWIEDLFEDTVIFSAGEELFTVPYRIDDNGIVTIVGIPLPVERNVSFVPKTNSQGEAMKDFILNALKEAGIEVNDLTDEQIFAKYNEHLQANQQKDDDLGEGNDKAELAAVVANALKPLTDKLDGMQTQLNAQSELDAAKAIDVIVNSGKYPGLDAESAKLLGLEKLKEMAANCGVSYGVSPITNHGKTDEAYEAPSEMPK